MYIQKIIEQLVTEAWEAGIQITEITLTKDQMDDLKMELTGESGKEIKNLKLETLNTFANPIKIVENGQD